MGGDAVTLLKIAAAVVVSMTYARFSSIWIHPGKLRLLSLLPVVILLPFLPWHFSSIFLRSSSAFLLVWLSTFKLLLLSFGIGPLSSSLPFATFLAISFLPVKLSNQKSQPPSSKSNQLFTSASSALLLSVLVCLYRFKTLIHPYLLLVMYALHVYLSLRLILASTAFLGNALFGLELEPPFDAPFRSDSLQDFWGRRWNLIVNDILCPSVYVPIRDRYEVAATYLTIFVVSEIIYEVIIYYVTLTVPTGRLLCFFLLQGLCNLAKTKVRREGWWQPSLQVSVLLALGFVTVIGF